MTIVEARRQAAQAQQSGSDAQPMSSPGQPKASDAQAGRAQDGPEADGVARVDGVALHAAGARPEAAELRQRACTELLRQAAQRAGLLAADDAASEDGVVSEAAAAAIEALLERELRVPEPCEEDCRRHHAANAARYADGERVLARHVLFAVTPGVDVKALLPRAEEMLLKLRCGDDTRDAGESGEGGEGGEGGGQGGSAPAGDAFAAAAREWSNCPSGAEGGALGWLRSTDCVPEFARELFAQPVVGVLPRLVRSRFGLHVVEVLAREPGVARPFEAVRGAVALALRQQAWTTALRQYLRLLAARADIEGVDLDAADTPLVQ
jgi:peptidyl-prolyl cis-trans isomerase C